MSKGWYYENYRHSLAAKGIKTSMMEKGNWRYPKDVFKDKRYTAKELEVLPTLSVGQTDDLKIDTGDTRIWLARTKIEDGEPYNNRVTVEKLIGGNWVAVEEYPGGKTDNLVAKRRSFQEKGETVGEMLKRLAESDTSTDEDSQKMQNLLRYAGFPKAVVVVGIVYLEGQGTMEAPPTSIHSVAKMLMKGAEGKESEEKDWEETSEGKLWLQAEGNRAKREEDYKGD
jgi:hypothetical protein